MPSETTLDIIVDLDGVVHDFPASLRHYLVEHGGYDADSLPEAETWDFPMDQWGLTVEEFVGHCNAGVDAGVVFAHGDPYPGAVAALGRLREAGHRLHVVTDRRFGTKSADNTERWLHEHNIRHLFDSVTFSADKTIVRADLAIEDNVKNHEALTSAGVPTVIMDRAWNRHYPAELRAKSWKAFEQIVAEFAEDRRTSAPDGALDETILEEAQRLIYGNRQASYGHPRHDFARTGRIWGAILADWAAETHGDEPVPPALVGLCMVGVKISREVNRPKRDNLVDGAGYFGTVMMVREAEDAIETAAGAEEDSQE